MNTIYRRMSGVLLLLMMLSPWAGANPESQSQTFPASIQVNAAPPLIEAIKNQFHVDSIDTGNINLYVESKDEYEKLQHMLQSFKTTKDYTISFLQTHTEAQKNFLEVDENGLSYHTYDSMLSEIRALEKRFPSFIKVISLGKGASGQTDIWAVKVSDNVDEDEDEPSTFIAGGIHGNERPGPEVVLHVLNYIATEYESNGPDNQVNRLVNQTQMWFIPISNPDGHQRNRRTNRNGVDLNRDFPSAWNGFQPSFMAQSETSAIVSHLNNHHFVAGIDLHTHGRMVMYPWAHTSANPQDLTVFQALGNMIGQAMGGYRVDSLYNFFGNIVGGSIDYEYGALGIIALGEELGTSHSPPVSVMAQLRSSNLPPALNFLDRINHDTLTGLVRDANTQQPVKAEIKINGIDTGGNRNPYQSRLPFGRYYRILPKGTYTVTVSANGYAPQTFTHVSMNSSGRTLLDVNLSATNTAEYCQSRSGSAQYEYLGRVRIGHINHSSNATGYSDFTSYVVEARRGESVAIELSPEFSSSAYQEYFGVWADLNHDGDFEDTGEKLFTAGPSREEVSGNISIPATAKAGTTRIRVVMQYDNSPSACGTYEYGETEDYALKIL